MTRRRRRPSCVAEKDPTAAEVDLDRFSYLHPDGQSLIQDWFKRASSSDPDESTEPFIFLWIAFNGWAACVTRADSDRKMISALASDDALREDFRRVTESVDSALGREARSFRELWPIFRADELRDLGLAHAEEGQPREDLVAAYLEGGAKVFEPYCWLERQTRHDDTLDWPHTVAALYRVRCNLFHGEKARTSENDQSVVHAAFEILRGFLGQGRYLA